MPHVILVLALVGLLTGSGAWAQTSPARIPLPAVQDKTPATRGDHPIDDMPLADYLGLLRQIAPAAEAGAKDYLAQTTPGDTWLDVSESDDGALSLKERK